MDETVRSIVSFVPRAGLFRCACVSTAWYAAATAPPRWRDATADPNDDHGGEGAALIPDENWDRRKLDEERYRNSPRARFCDGNRRSLVTTFRWAVRDWARKSDPEEPPSRTTPYSALATRPTFP